MKYTIEEVMTSHDLPAGLVPHLLMSEMVCEGPRVPLVWLTDGLIDETTELVGKDGTVVKIPVLSQLSASSETAEAVEDDVFAGYTASDKTVTKVDITVASVIYCAFKLTRILVEDNPSIDWVRLMLRNARAAVEEYMNADIRTVVEAASGTETASVTNLSYSEIVDIITKLELTGWIAGDAPFLIISPSAKAYLLKQSEFIATERYTTHELERMVEGEIGMYAGCRVLVDVGLEGLGKAYMISPRTDYGPRVLFVWKRLIQTKSESYEAKEKDFYVITSRYKVAVVQPKSIVKIDISSSP